MGADVKILRNRIKSIDSTLHLTKAMGLVASSKMRRALRNMNSMREYFASVENAVKILTRSPECRKSPFMQKRETGRTRLVVIAGDRGLAGGYNSNVIKLAKQYPDAEIYPIGKRACERYDMPFISSENFTYSQASQMAKNFCEDFVKGEYDRLGIVTTHYVSMLSQEAQIRWILPLMKDDEPSSGSVIFEPDESTVLSMITEQYVSSAILKEVRESYASENAARKNAMDSAGKNAQEMVDNLTVQYNRARQGVITQEITEIVAGAGES